MEQALYTLYKKKGCGWCTKAEALLEEKGLPYSVVEVGVDITREALLEKFPNSKLMPIIEKNGTLIGGYVDLIDDLNGKFK